MVYVLAPTSTAAYNVKEESLHHFAGLCPTTLDAPMRETTIKD